MDFPSARRAVIAYLIAGGIVRAVKTDKEAFSAYDAVATGSGATLTQVRVVLHDLQSRNYVEITVDPEGFVLTVAATGWLFDLASLEKIGPADIPVIAPLVRRRRQPGRPRIGPPPRQRIPEEVPARDELPLNLDDLEPGERQVFEVAATSPSVYASRNPLTVIARHTHRAPHEAEAALRRLAEGGWLKLQEGTKRGQIRITRVEPTIRALQAILAADPYANGLQGALETLTTDLAQPAEEAPLRWMPGPGDSEDDWEWRLRPRPIHDGLTQPLAALFPDDEPEGGDTEPVVWRSDDPRVLEELAAALVPEAESYDTALEYLLILAALQLFAHLREIPTYTRLRLSKMFGIPHPQVRNRLLYLRRWGYIVTGTVRTRRLSVQLPHAVQVRITPMLAHPDIAALAEEVRKLADQSLPPFTPRPDEIPRQDQNGFYTTEVAYPSAEAASTILAIHLHPVLTHHPESAIEQLVHLLNPGETKQFPAWIYKRLGLLAQRGWLHFDGGPPVARLELTPAANLLLSSGIIRPAQDPEAVGSTTQPDGSEFDTVKVVYPSRFGQDILFIIWILENIVTEPDVLYRGAISLSTAANPEQQIRKLRQDGWLDYHIRSPRVPVCTRLELSERALALLEYGIIHAANP